MTPPEKNDFKQSPLQSLYLGSTPELTYARSGNARFKPWVRNRIGEEDFIILLETIGSTWTGKPVLGSSSQGSLKW